MTEKKEKRTESQREASFEILVADLRSRLDLRRILFIVLGLALFAVLYYLPLLPDAVDPLGKHFPLSREGKGAIALFLLACTWWVFEVIPIGVTGIAIGVFQALFMIRPAKEAFRCFFDPSVWFIFGSIVIGMVFTKTGLTRRLAYKMLTILGEKTSMIYLGCFMLTTALTHVMAHTAVAATVYPLLLAIYYLYGEGDRPTKFGKGLFIGMAYVAGAGSIISLLGSARAAVAIGFFNEITHKNITFFELSKYMFFVGWMMTLFLWLYILVVFKPEKQSIPGLREKAARLYKEMGPITGKEAFVGLVVFGIILFLSLQSFVGTLTPFDKSAVILVATLLFYLTRILTIKELEEIPLNIILLFGGAMSIGFCLWETGAAQWVAINWLVMFHKASGFVFVLTIALFVMVMTNLIMNVVAVAISLPVTLVLVPYLKVAPEVVLFASLVAAGMPFLLLVGAAPNAIAYDSKQFTAREFFKAGIPASVLLMAVIGFAVAILWPLLGMPVAGK